MKVYLYGTLGHLGGASTKIRHLLRLLHKEVDFAVILTHPCQHQNKRGRGAACGNGKRSLISCLAIVDDGEGVAGTGN